MGLLGEGGGQGAGRLSAGKFRILWGGGAKYFFGAEMPTKFKSKTKFVHANVSQSGFFADFYF